MQLALVVATSADVAATRSRAAKVARIAELLRAAPLTEAPVAASYLAGRLPLGRVGVGGASLVKLSAIAPAPGPSLELADVERAVEAIAAASGKGAQRVREHLLGALFARATRAEQLFLAALLVGELRQGALEALVLEGLAAATSTPIGVIRRAYMLAGDLGAVTQATLEGGAAALARFDLQLFQPVRPMLAQTAEDVADALARLGEASFERKLDGARIQAHKDGDEVRIFTRNLNDVTARVPEIVEALRCSPARSLVLDGEAIALEANGRPRPFQVTMRRFGRRSEVERARAAIPLDAFYFDCLYLDGESLLDRPARERMRALDEALLPPTGGVVHRTITADPDEALAAFRDALHHGHEGLVAKSLDAPYEAGNRGGSWLKLKTAHTLDLAVLAAEWGSGRRQGFLSNLHLGARDEASGELVMLGKTFKGLTDAMLAFQTERLLALETGREGPVVWVRPELVVEVAANEIQASPRYPAGLALRFARVKRYRLDKGPADVDTLATVRAIHRAGVATTA